MGETIKKLNFTESNRTATFNSSAFSVKESGKIPAKLSAFLDATSVTGTLPNWTVKFQYSYDNILWTDIVSGAFPVLTAAGKGDMNGIAWPGSAPLGRYVGTLNSGTATDFDFNLKVDLHN